MDVAPPAPVSQDWWHSKPPPHPHSTIPCFEGLEWLIKRSQATSMNMKELHIEAVTRGRSIQKTEKKNPLKPIFTMVTLNQWQCLGHTEFKHIWGNFPIFQSFLSEFLFLRDKSASNTAFSLSEWFLRCCNIWEKLTNMLGPEILAFIFLWPHSPCITLHPYLKSPNLNFLFSVQNVAWGLSVSSLHSL